VCLCFCIMSEDRKPLAGSLSAENWVHASEFVPGQMWLGLGKSNTWLVSRWKPHANMQLMYVYCTQSGSVCSANNLRRRGECKQWPSGTLLLTNVYSGHDTALRKTIQYESGTMCHGAVTKTSFTPPLWHSRRHHSVVTHRAGFLLYRFP